MMTVVYKAYVYFVIVITRSRSNVLPYTLDLTMQYTCE